MLQLSHKQCAAVEAVVHIACYGSTDALSGKALAEAIGQQPRYLEPMLQQLVHAGILRGIRGPKGGYVLAKERRRISVRKICEALNEEEEQLPVRNSSLGQKLVSPICESALNAAYATMEGISLAELCQKAQQASMPQQATKPDFTI